MKRRKWWEEGERRVRLTSSPVSNSELGPTPGTTRTTSEPRSLSPQPLACHGHRGQLDDAHGQSSPEVPQLEPSSIPVHSSPSPSRLLPALFDNTDAHAFNSTDPDPKQERCQSIFVIQRATRAAEARVHCASCRTFAGETFATGGEEPSLTPLAHQPPLFHETRVYLGIIEATSRSRGRVKLHLFTDAVLIAEEEEGDRLETIDGAPVPELVPLSSTSYKGETFQPPQLLLSIVNVLADHSQPPLRSPLKYSPPPLLYHPVPPLPIPTTPHAIPLSPPPTSNSTPNSNPTTLDPRFLTLNLRNLSPNSIHHSHSSSSL